MILIPLSEYAANAASACQRSYPFLSSCYGRLNLSTSGGFLIFFWLPCQTHSRILVTIFYTYPHLIRHQKLPLCYWLLGLLHHHAIDPHLNKEKFLVFFISQVTFDVACSTNFSLSSNDNRIFGASLSWGVDCLETGVAEDDGLVDGSHVMGPLYLWPNPRDRPVLSDSPLLFSYFSDVSLSLSLCLS